MLEEGAMERLVETMEPTGLDGGSPIDDSAPEADELVGVISEEMPAGSIDLRALVARMANRGAPRTEANVQSDLHTLLTAASLNLDADDVESITLESPAGQRRRIDVEVGFTDSQTSV
jgi:hypothetical protein